MSPTDPRTGISALLVDTGQAVGTLVVNNTLGLALHIRVSSIVADTFARGCAVPLRTLSIDTARRGVTRLDHRDRPSGG